MGGIPQASRPQTLPYVLTNIMLYWLPANGRPSANPLLREHGSNIVHRSDVDRRGNVAAMEAPGHFVGDVRAAFFRELQ